MGSGTTISHTEMSWACLLPPWQMLPRSPQRSPVKTASTERPGHFSPQNRPSEFHLTQSQSPCKRSPAAPMRYLSSPPPTHSTPNHRHTSFYHSHKPSALLTKGLCGSTAHAWNTLPPDLYRVFPSPSSVRLSLNTLHCFQSTYGFLIDCIFFLLVFSLCLVSTANSMKVGHFIFLSRRHTQYGAQRGA